MSLRQKLNTKLNIAKKQQEGQQGCFDETSIRINAVGGQTQLCPIKLNCTWEGFGWGSKILELSSKWFNLTQNSIEQIADIKGSYYQPCMEDIGTIIHIQCMPEAEGLEYEGMPIIKDIGPIKLDPETEEQANDLLDCGKASFLIKLLNIDQSVQYHEGLMKVADGFLTIIDKLKGEKELIRVNITKQSPITVSNRVSPKKLTIKFPKQYNIQVQFSNNKIRDIFILLLKLISSSSQTQHEQTDKPKQEISEITQTPAKSEKSEGKKEQKLSKSQQSEEKTHSKIEQKVSSSNKSNINDIEQDKKIEQVRSQGDFTVINNKIDKNLESQNRKNTQEIQQLKQKIKILTQTLQQQRKQKKSGSEYFQQLKHELSVLKQRQMNFNNNYFLLQQSLKKTRQQLVKAQQEMIYYKNECRMAKADKEVMERKANQLAIQNAQLKVNEQKWSSNSEQISYDELMKRMQREEKDKKQLEYLLQCERKEGEKWGEKLMEINQQLQRVGQQKQFYRRKYQNLHLQLTNNPSFQSSISQGSSIYSPVKTRPDTSLKKITSEQTNNIFQNSDENIERMETEILALKKQVKQVVDENNFLRSLNIGTKQKTKSSSKAHLKMQLAELKKIVNRLTETLTEKDIALQHMKKVNKDLNKKIAELVNISKQET